MNDGLGKVKFISFRVILYSVAISSMIFGKNMPKLRKKNTKEVFWNIQGSGLILTKQVVYKCTTYTK